MIRLKLYRLKYSKLHQFFGSWFFIQLFTVYLYTLKSNIFSVLETVGGRYFTDCYVFQYNVLKRSVLQNRPCKYHIHWIACRLHSQSRMSQITLDGKLSVPLYSSVQNVSGQYVLYLLVHYVHIHPVCKLHGQDSI